MLTTSSYSPLLLFLTTPVIPYIVKPYTIKGFTPTNITITPSIKDFIIPNRATIYNRC